MKTFSKELEFSRRWSLATLKKKAAQDWQKCVRAEAAAVEAHHPAIVNSKFVRIYSPLGTCVCVTCGAVKPWNTNELDAGHFIGGRSNSILFEPLNCHPQCKWCNRTGGQPEAYRRFMQHSYGEDVIETLERLKREARSFSREELVSMRREYRARVKHAEVRMS